MTSAPPVRAARPLLRFVRGRPDEEEIAAATLAVLAALATRTPPPEAPGPTVRAPGSGYRAPGSWTARRRFTHHD
ncbi:acyl-CoA carboxylase epsilon subunit [Streptomyces sp. NPDC048362]|uniref:acyl-CoA carboxylase epsilon subunit n=1 Tax=unclassified Streptomyces TaxID=2593676 RepID=UPI0033C9EE4D